MSVVMSVVLRCLLWLGLICAAVGAGWSLRQRRVTPGAVTEEANLIAQWPAFVNRA
jgi:hypothetical protein